MQFEEGRIVIVAWQEPVSNGNDGVSWANLALGGETRKELYELSARMKAATLHGEAPTYEL